MKMQKSLKRKQLGVDGHSKTPKITTEEPHPSHHKPTPDECRSVRDELLALHGFPAEFLKYRHQRLIKTEPTIDAKSEPLNNNYDDGEESVLDGLVKTVLSQNTTELNSQKAFASLKSAFPTWEDVSFLGFLSFSCQFFLFSPRFALMDIAICWLDWLFLFSIFGFIGYQLITRISFSFFL